jgi:hypothetical protein
VTKPPRLRHRKKTRVFAAPPPRPPSSNQNASPLTATNPTAQATQSTTANKLNAHVPLPPIGAVPRCTIRPAMPPIAPAALIDPPRERTSTPTRADLDHLRRRTRKHNTSAALQKNRGPPRNCNANLRTRPRSVYYARSQTCSIRRTKVFRLLLPSTPEQHLYCLRSVRSTVHSVCSVHFPPIQ